MGFPWYAGAAGGCPGTTVATDFAVSPGFSEGVGDDSHAARMKSDDKLKRQVVRVIVRDVLVFGRNSARDVVRWPEETTGAVIDDRRRSV